MKHRNLDHVLVVDYRLQLLGDFGEDRLDLNHAGLLSRRRERFFVRLMRHRIKDNPMPKVQWKHSDVDGKARLTVTAAPPPQAARLWVASAATRDFRLAQWKEHPLTVIHSGVGDVTSPSEGCVAFFTELDYSIDGLTHQVSTQMRILEATLK